MYKDIDIHIHIHIYIYIHTHTHTLTPFFSSFRYCSIARSRSG